MNTEVEELNIYEHKFFYNQAGFKVASGHVNYELNDNLITFKYNGATYGVDVLGLDKPIEWFESICKKAKYSLERRLIKFAFEASRNESIYEKENGECGVIGLDYGSELKLTLDGYVRLHKDGSIGYETFTELNSFIWGHYYA